MNKIHPNAIIKEGAIIGKNCEIGANCYVGENVVMGANNIMYSGAIVDGYTTLGDGNKIFPYAVVGTDPQDLKYNGEPTRLLIGNNNTIREFATINRSNGTDEDTVWVIITSSWSMFIAHNCQIGSYCSWQMVQLVGTHVHDYVSIGGVTAVHQFVKIELKHSWAVHLPSKGHRSFHAGRQPLPNRWLK